MRRVAALLVGLALVVVGVACLVAGNRTHRAVKIDGLVLPHYVRQVGALPAGKSVQVGRDGWEIVTGGLLILNGRRTERALSRIGRPLGEKKEPVRGVV